MFRFGQNCSEQYVVPVFSQLGNMSLSEFSNSSLSVQLNLTAGNGMISFALVRTAPGMTINTIKGLIFWPLTSILASLEPYRITVSATNQLGASFMTFFLA